jgi:hypothetical protein
VFAVFSTHPLELLDIAWVLLETPDELRIVVDRLIGGETSHRGDVMERMFCPEEGLREERFYAQLRVVIAAQIGEDKEGIWSLTVSRVEQP